VEEIISKVIFYLNLQMILLKKDKEPVQGTSTRSAAKEKEKRTKTKQK
jgi:hypothetical protein